MGTTEKKKLTDKERWKGQREEKSGGWEKKLRRREKVIKGEEGERNKKPFSCKRTLYKGLGLITSVAFLFLLCM